MQENALSHSYHLLFFFKDLFKSEMTYYVEFTLKYFPKNRLG